MVSCCWPWLCCSALLGALLSSAATDERFVEQREITFDPDQKGVVEPDQSDMMQREVDWSEFFDPKDFIEQIMESPEKPDKSDNDLGGSRPGPRGFGPRSFGPPILDYPVQFPLSRPTSDNLQAICLHADRRPRYPDSYFPSSGFGQQRRKGSAVNQAESWFSICCERNETQSNEMTLCCATQAWELSVKSFCEEDSSVKDRLYHCCKETGSNRLDCFNRDSQNPNYEPTELIPVPPLDSTANFTFDPNNCERSVMTPYSVRKSKDKKKKKTAPSSEKVDINFPPGRPTAATIESLCRNQALRPRYSVKCLPGTGYVWLARQAKTINRMEKGFKHCCKKKHDVLKCAEQKWKDELNKFCSGKKGGKMDFQCCSADTANDRLSCFQNISPDPHYNTTSEELSLGKICDTHKVIKKQFPVGFPLKGFVELCCPLSEQERTSCSMQKLEEMSASVCSGGKALPATIRRCCRASSPDAPQCLSKVLMEAITKASKVLRQKKKKRCPIS